MRLSLVALSILVVSFPLLISGLQAKSQDTGFLNRVVREGSTTYRYQVYLPLEWKKSQKWPVILFLHGAGERGEHGLIQTEVGIGTAIRRHQERFPCIVVFPQCRRDVLWTAPEMESQALKALVQTIHEFKGDRRRLYLTGLSMGGFGTWSIASKHPDLFAALAPICGGLRRREDPATDLVPYVETAGKIGKTPVWVFHGSDDNVVPVSESRKMVEALKDVGGEVKYNEYEVVGHNSWDRAYSDPELITWMLSKHREFAKP